MGFKIGHGLPVGRLVTETAITLAYTFVLALMTGVTTQRATAELRSKVAGGTPDILVGAGQGEFGLFVMVKPGDGRGSFANIGPAIGAVAIGAFWCGKLVRCLVAGCTIFGRATKKYHRDFFRGCVAMTGTASHFLMGGQQRPAGFVFMIKRRQFERCTVMTGVTMFDRRLTLKLTVMGIKMARRTGTYACSFC